MIGIGSDLLDIRRIEKTISRFGDRFKNKIFTKNEINKCEKRLNLFTLNNRESSSFIFSRENFI